MTRQLLLLLVGVLAALSAVQAFLVPATAAVRGWVAGLAMQWMLGAVNQSSASARPLTASNTNASRRGRSLAMVGEGSTHVKQLAVSGRTAKAAVGLNAYRTFPSHVALATRPHAHTPTPAAGAGGLHRRGPGQVLQAQRGRQARRSVPRGRRLPMHEMMRESVGCVDSLAAHRLLNTQS